MPATNEPIRALVVDDTALYRKIVGDVLTSLPGVQVVGSAHNGRVALDRIAALNPDLVTLDIEMPLMNGIEVLENLKSSGSKVGVIMVSSLTRRGGDMTIRALSLGAFDFITKPTGRSLAENTRAVREALAPLVNNFILKRRLRSLVRARTAPRPGIPAAGGSPGPRPAAAVRHGPSRIVAIGISTGGPNALTAMMPRLPGDMGVPVVIVQHMPPVFTRSLARSLDAKCALQVKEGEDGEELKADVAYIAPGGRQMKVITGGNGFSRILRITDDPPENNCCPSADYLFRSVSQQYAGRATGVIMTGMGTDGLLGLRRMKRSGAVIIAQDEATCVVYGMPKGPTEAGIVDIVTPLQGIAAEIVKTVRTAPQAAPPAGVRTAVPVDLRKRNAC